MFGVLATVVLIATYGTYGEEFSEEALHRAYWFGEEYSAEFRNAKKSIELFRMLQEEQISKNGLILRPAEEPPTSVEQSLGVDEDCLIGNHHGIVIPELLYVAQQIYSFRWVYDLNNSEQGTSYFTILFQEGLHGPLHLTVPIFPEPFPASCTKRDDKEWQQEHKIGYPSLDLEEQLWDLVNYYTNSIKVSFEWLEELLGHGIFENKTPYIYGDMTVNSYVTRPIFLPRLTINAVHLECKFGQNRPPPRPGCMPENAIVIDSDSD